MFILSLLFSFSTICLAATYTEKCRVRYFDQLRDHFSFSSSDTFKHRVLYNLDHYEIGGPIFFYLGNEAKVELYVEHSGLMWENAKKFQAALIFAEHRYYGESKVFSDDSCSMSYLTTEQALADYAVVLDVFKRELSPSAVIGFGGSYGGMLATVFRFQYPHMVDGVIAASAPVLAYQGLSPPYDSNGFAKVVTRDAGPKCASAFKSALIEIESKGKTNEGRSDLSNIFSLCKQLKTTDDVSELMEWISSSWDYLAMGNFPYPSSYVQPDGALLPGYPVKAACNLVLSGSTVLEGVAAAAGLFYNATGAKTCFLNSQEPYLITSRRNLQGKKSCEGTWDYQWCTEHNMPFTSGTNKDMFYPPTGPFDIEVTNKQCLETWGVKPNPDWARITYGGIKGLQKGLTNVVFSNGYLDPWSAGGVLDTSGFDESVVAVMIPNGAHHLDLMFSSELDPLDVKIARQIELNHITKWINQAKHKKRNPFVALD